MISFDGEGSNQNEMGGGKKESILLWAPVRGDEIRLFVSATVTTALTMPSVGTPTKLKPGGESFSRVPAASEPLPGSFVPSHFKVD